MIDFNEEELLTMSQASKVCPKVDGKPPHCGSIWRWARKGIRGIRLEHVRIGNRVCTSLDALNRFFNALAETPPPAPSQHSVVREPTGRTESQREKAMAAARKRLESRGVIQVTEH